MAWYICTQNDKMGEPKYRVLYLAKLSLRSDGEITNFTDKQKLRESSSTEAALWQMLKELLKEGNRDKEKIYKN